MNHFMLRYRFVVQQFRTSVDMQNDDGRNDGNTNNLDHKHLKLDCQSNKVLITITNCLLQFLFRLYLPRF